MEERKGNIILGIILAILMVIAIVIVIINPNKISKTTETSKNIQEDTNLGKQTNNIDQTNSEEEKEMSMHIGGTFCKIENQIAFYEDINKSIYLYNVNDGSINKIATLENGADKIYFDGENIYFMPNYYKGKGIYRVNLQGVVTKISTDSSLQLWITEDKIYFVKQIGYDDFNHNPQGTVCVMNKDGSDVVEIAQNIKNNFFIQNEKIYYTTQDRKMYSIDNDGKNQEELVQGRKFTMGISEKYLLYIDYANQEAEHILNLETKEDSIIGNYGTLKKYQGKTYLNARKRLDDGSLENEFTLFEIQDDATVKEIGKIANMGTELKYIVNKKAYLSTQQEGTYTINLENNQKETEENYNDCRFFLGGYGYKINDADINDIKIERIEL